NWRPPQGDRAVTARGIIVAAPGSSAGKTTVTLPLATALKRRGEKVRTAKAGPDYIEPAVHTPANGPPTGHLHTWAMPPALLDTLAAKWAWAAVRLVMEGAMGLFDAFAKKGGRGGPTAALARRYGLPVLLVLDVVGQSQSAAAVVRGFATHDA